MKKIAFIFFLTTILFSCKKENDRKFPENPDWLNKKISQMETANYYMGTTVYAYEWHNENYYLISPPLSSCYMCEFYSYSGQKYEMNAEKYNDFSKNAIIVKIVWQRE